MRLLTPLPVGPVTLRNRVVSTAHGAFLDFYRPGVAPDQYVAYQERRARGGCGLVILQTMQVHPSSQSFGHFMWERDDILPKFRAMAGAVHAHGTRVVVQIGHFGGQFRSDGNDDLAPRWGFSPIRAPSGWEPVHAMTADEVESVVQGFVDTAVVAVEGGLDGVELHATHGYLLQQSFSPWANARKDGWGDPLRFLDEVTSRVRAAVGSDAVVGLRISADDWVPHSRGGLGADGLRAVAGHVCESGLVDYLNHSEGSRSAHYARSIADYEGVPGEFLPLTAGLRRVAGGVPVIAVGKILTPGQAEQALADGVCDLVALTRAQIADPDLVLKAAAGEADRIRPCVGANTGCVDRMQQGLPITCFHNPDVGREWRLGDLQVASRRKRVLVVGAGPAGLKAAETAARRGHTVTVMDRAHRAGGRLRLVEPLGPPAALLGSVDWLLAELGRLDVEVRLGVEVDAGAIAGSRPDAVVLATGAHGTGWEAPSDGSVDVVAVDTAMGLDVTGSRVVLVDLLGNQEQAWCAERLARDGAAVTLLTPFPSAGPNIGFTHFRRHMERLYGLGVVVEPLRIVTGIAEGAVQARHVYSREERAFAADLVVSGGMPEPDLSLLDAAESACDVVLLAGDNVAPRTALHAFREGANAGRMA